MNRLIVTIVVLLSLVLENQAMVQKKEKVDCNWEPVKSARLANYGVVTVDEIKQDMKSVLTYLEKNTPSRVVNKQNGKIITEYAKMDQNAQLERGAFSLISTECERPIRPCLLRQRLQERWSIAIMYINASTF